VALRGGARFGVAPGEIRLWLRAVIGELAPSARSLGVSLCGDRTMRILNREHRGLDKPTDVLSFPGGASLEGYHLGDIVISVPQARRQAEAAGHALDRELRLLLLHGVLHCLGHDHETDDGAMDRLERRLRRRWLDGP
jgi:probable rRNA maturation factor